jgi:hypothetical protein
VHLARRVAAGLWASRAPDSRKPDTRRSPLRRSHYRGRVGFNPFRQQVQRGSDIVIVAVALVVIAALVLWAMFG